MKSLEEIDISTLSDDELLWLLESLPEDDPLRQEIIEYVE